jgi:hypothetical protein
MFAFERVYMETTEVADEAYEQESVFYKTRDHFRARFK